MGLDQIAFNFCPPNQSWSLKGPSCVMCSALLHNNPLACVVKIKQNQEVDLRAGNMFPRWGWTWQCRPIKEISFHMGLK